MAGKEQWAGFIMVGLAVYFVSESFLNYWPLGLFQSALALAFPLLIKRGGVSSSPVFGVGLVVLSFLLGFLMAFVEGQVSIDWRFSLYFLVHGLWLLVFLNKCSGAQGAGYMRLAVSGFFFVICLIHGNEIHVSQKLIAFLEFLLFMLAFFVYGRGLFEARVLWFWFFCVTVVLAVSNMLAIGDGIEPADWWRVLQVSSHLLLAAVLWVWLRRDVEGPYWLAVAIALAVFVYVFALLVVWFNMVEPAQHNWFSYPVWFAHIRHLGYFVCVGVVIGAWAMLVASGKLRWIAWVTYVLALSILLWSGGRGALLSALVGMALLLRMAPLRTHVQSWGLLFTGLLLSFLFSALFHVERSDVGWISALVRSDAAGSPNALSTGRLYIWARLFEFVAQRPVLGWGGEGFMAVWEGGAINQAHNVLLQALIEWGWLGALVIGLPLSVLVLQGGWRYLAGEAMTLPLAGLGAALVSALLVFSMVDGIFYYGLPLAFVVFGCCALQASTQKSVAFAKDLG